MRVCIIGDFNDDLLDEGLKNVAHHLADSISEIPGIEVLKVNNKSFDLPTLRQLKQFSPHILHYVPGVTNVSIVFLKVIRWFLNNPKVFLSATFPTFNDTLYRVINLKPSCVFAPSKALKTRLDALGTPSIVLPNGVDLERFVPVSAMEKRALRKKYGLSLDKFTTLHVGHLLKQRGLDRLADLAGTNQVVLVASGYQHQDPAILKNLQEHGCTVFLGYFENIQEFYQLADCYIFPITHLSGSILCPLSVLEAMACNLPVVASNINDIGTFFEEGKGLTFATEDEDFFQAVENIKAGEVFSATREKVQRYSWQAIAATIANVYLESLSNGCV